MWKTAESNFVSACFTTSECAVPADRYLVMGEAAVNYWITAVPDGGGKKLKGKLKKYCRPSAAVPCNNKTSRYLLARVDFTAPLYVRPRYDPQFGHATWASVGAPQFGHAIVVVALAFHVERRVCVFAREVLYFGSAMGNSFSFEQIYLSVCEFSATPRNCALDQDSPGGRGLPGCCGGGATVSSGLVRIHRGFS